MTAPTPNAKAKPTAQYMSAAIEKLARIFAITVPAFLPREKPISRKAKPACMNITRQPATITHRELMATESGSAPAFAASKVSAAATAGTARAPRSPSRDPRASNERRNTQPPRVVRERGSVSGAPLDRSLDACRRIPAAVSHIGRFARKLRFSPCPGEGWSGKFGHLYKGSRPWRDYAGAHAQNPHAECHRRAVEPERGRAGRTRPDGRAEPDLRGQRLLALGPAPARPVGDLQAPAGDARPGAAARPDPGRRRRLGDEGMGDGEGRHPLHPLVPAADRLDRGEARLLLRADRGRRGDRRVLRQGADPGGA